MKDAECAKTNEKLFFGFLFFELWSFCTQNINIFDE